MKNLTVVIALIALALSAPLTAQSAPTTTTGYLSIGAEMKWWPTSQRWVSAGLTATQEKGVVVSGSVLLKELTPTWSVTARFTGFYHPELTTSAGVALEKIIIKSLAISARASLNNFGDEQVGAGITFRF